MTGTGDGSLRERLDAFIASEHERPRPDGPAAFEDLVAFQQRLDDAGLAVVTWPTEYGGEGRPPEDGLAVASALGRGGLPEVVNFVGIDVLSPALMQFYDPAALRELLPLMASGQEIWCQMFSEPEAGSDLASLSARAEPVPGGGWRVTGQKTWSTWGAQARRGVLLARTGSRESRHRGITAFVVDMELAGITARPLTTMTGEAEFAEVFLDDVRLPPEALLGEVDGGWDVAQVILASERGTYAIRRGSVLRAKYDRLVELARSVPVSSPAQDVLVDAWLALYALECRMATVAEQVSSGVDPGPAAAGTKILLTRAEQAIGQAGVALLGVGAVAWTSHMPDEVEGYLYSRAASIYGGTAQIQRNIIAERLLGLPREPLRT